jgi:hypothetical protein
VVGSAAFMRGKNALALYAGVSTLITLVSAGNAKALMGPCGGDQ